MNNPPSTNNGKEKEGNDKMNEDSLYVCKLCFEVMLCFLSNSLVGLDEAMAKTGKTRTTK